MKNYPYMLQKYLGNFKMFSSFKNFLTKNSLQKKKIILRVRNSKLGKKLFQKKCESTSFLKINLHKI